MLLLQVVNETMSFCDNSIPLPPPVQPKRGVTDHSQDSVSKGESDIVSRAAAHLCILYFVVVAGRYHSLVHRQF